jgi:hypothetical protein
MSERLPYEEMDRQFNDLPLPDEEASWQKMKELLDNDNNDDIIPPPIFLRSCLGWGIILLVGLTAAWLMVRPEKWWSENAKSKQTSSSNKIQKQVIKEKPVENKNTNSKPLTKKDETDIFTTSKQKEIISPVNSPVTNQIKKKISVKAIPSRSQSNEPDVQKPVNQNEDREQEEPTKITNGEIVNQKNTKRPDTSFTTTNQQQSLIKTDSSEKQNITQPTDSTSQKKAKQSKKKFFLVAGVGEQQPIPIAGQTAVPYSHYGRKGSLSDYVPSVYVQLQKEKKWFIQGEFRYGAAQSVREFSYNRNTKYDTASMNVTTTTMRLKKTYYHQLPLSFNYCLEPNLSIGIGGVYSRFYGAITEKEINTLNVITQTTTTFKQIIPVKHFTDSFLYKTQVHVLVQADYQWKKFSFGLRYTKDIQPYIKYTKPDGTVDEEKNQSLQFMVRYKLWQSKRS